MGKQEESEDTEMVVVGVVVAGLFTTAGAPPELLFDMMEGEREFYEERVKGDWARNLLKLRIERPSVNTLSSF
jgi:hypothetical protein